jgi:hypothetical protein
MKRYTTKKIVEVGVIFDTHLAELKNYHFEL